MPDCLCDKCAALCCRYFALPIDAPTTMREYDDIRWYLIHENVVVFIEKKQWYLGVLTRCKNLQLDNRCGIYETRPRICRKYSTDNCDYHGGEYDFEQLFTSGEQLLAYGKVKLKEERGKKRPRPKAKPRVAQDRPTVKAHPSGPRRGQGASRQRIVEIPVATPAVRGNGRLSLPVLRG